MFCNKKILKLCKHSRMYKLYKIRAKYSIEKKKYVHNREADIPDTRNFRWKTSDFISFLALSKYVTEPLYTSVGYSYECTWYAFGMRMRAERGSEKVSREKSEIQKLSAELKTFLNHVGLPRSSSPSTPLIPGDLISLESRVRNVSYITS